MSKKKWMVLKWVIIQAIMVGVVFVVFAAVAQT